MKTTNYKLNKNSLKFQDPDLERQFLRSYDENIRIPLRVGIVISLISWYSAISLVYLIIPGKAPSLVPITLVYIGSYFGFLIYSTFDKRFKGYYHTLGAISNAWAGLYAIYYCDHFPGGEHLILPVIIFIIFFGSYLVRLKWIAGFLAALSYIICYQVYLLDNQDITDGQVLLYSFVAWMTLIFAFLAGRITEKSSRTNFAQEMIIQEQSAIILAEKAFLLKEVHHRVKNNLQIILSLIKMQHRHNNNEPGMDSLEDLETKILSLATVHQWLRKQGHFEKVDAHEITSDIVDNIIETYNIKDPQYQIYSADSIDLDIEKASSYALLLNEVLLILVKPNKGFELIIEQSMNGDHFEVLFIAPASKELPAEVKESELIDALKDQLEATLQIKSADNQTLIELRFDPLG